MAASDPRAKVPQRVMNSELARRAAEVLGCSENTVSWRMHKARKMLRVRLGPFLKEAGS